MQSTTRSAPEAAATVAKNEPLERIRNLLKSHGCRNVGDNWTCPAHEDVNPSLTVRAGGMHPVVLFCHAGCKPEDVLTALGTTWREVLNGNPKKIVATESYVYHDERKEPLFRVQRLTMADGSKTFRQHCALPDGGWAIELLTDRLHRDVAVRVVHELQHSQVLDLLGGLDVSHSRIVSLGEDRPKGLSTHDRTNVRLF